MNPLPFSITTSTVRLLSRSIAIDAGFERFTAALEKVVGHFPSDFERELIARPQLAEQRIKAVEGAEGLMIVSVFDHGAVLNMVSARANARQYPIGNPLTAISMTRHDIRGRLACPTACSSIARSLRRCARNSLRLPSHGSRISTSNPGIRPEP